MAQAAGEIKAQTGREVGVTVADLTKAADIERLVAATVRQFGGVYTLVNNSGGPPAGTFDAFDDAAWQAAFELNLLSYVRAIRAVLPHMRKGGGGRIVNYASSSVKAPLENLILSNTFRTGVMGLTKTLAGELGKDNILVNLQGCGRPRPARRRSRSGSMPARRFPSAATGRRRNSPATPCFSARPPTPISPGRPSSSTGA